MDGRIRHHPAIFMTWPDRGDPEEALAANFPVLAHFARPLVRRHVPFVSLEIKMTEVRISRFSVPGLTVQANGSTIRAHLQNYPG